MKLKTIMLLVVLMSAQLSFSQIIKETHWYAIKGKDTLYIDRIYDPAVAAPANRPTMIYMYGGGWAFGDRGGDFRYLTDIGVQVFSIDYRKALTRYGYSNVIGTMPDTMSYAIDVALQDLTDAIAFVLSHSKEWAVDSKKVMLSGSSAGAVTTLHAIYDICNQGKYSKKFPDDFMPAGYIAYAGAIISEASDLKWNKKPCPMMFFHGSGDMVVPISKRNVNKLTIFGPEYILNQLHEMEVPNWFYIEEGADHVISYKPFTGYNTAEIQTFITKFVIQGLKLEMYTKEKNMVAPSKLPGF
jgi:acetyl esterase/lipase